MLDVRAERDETQLGHASGRPEHEVAARIRDSFPFRRKRRTSSPRFTATEKR